MSTEETIKALAEEILEPVYKKCHPGIDEWSFDYWKRNVPFGKAIISAMCEMYKAALSGTERVECYLPVDKVEFGKEIEKDGAINLVGGRDLGGKPRWLKKTVLTVVRESEPSRDYSISENGEITK